MAKETGVLGFIEYPEDGQPIHRVTSELLRGVYHPEWKNNLPKLGLMLRRQLKRGELCYRCDCCGGRLYLAGQHFEAGEERRYGQQRLHLRHCSEKEQKAECVYRREEHSDPSEIDRMGHINKKESPEHFKLKAIVKESLERMFPECDVLLEKWIAVADTRRRPDINIIFKEDGLLPKGSEIAIEIQVAQIMMYQVNRRMDIDGAGGKYTLWILDSYNAEDTEENKIYKEDIYEASGLNAFVLDDEAIHMTEETGNLHLHVWYDTYKIENEEMAKAVVLDKIVPFTDLTFEKDSSNLSVYYYPSLKEREKCLTKVKKLQQEKEARQKAMEEENERMRILEEAEKERLRIEREKERIAQEEKRRALNQKIRYLDSFLNSIIYPGPWNGDLASIITYAKDTEGAYDDFLGQIKMVVSFNNHTWNDIANYILFLLSAPCRVIADNEDVLKYLIGYLGEKPKMKQPVQIPLSKIAIEYPRLEPYLLGISVNPNYAITPEDISAAKSRISELQPADKINGLNADDRLSFCYWSSLIFVDRIQKEPSITDKDSTLQLLVSKWMAICVFLSLQVGHIVGFRYPNWVQFADYIKTKFPEYARLFIQLSERRGYSLRSKTKDQGEILKRFIAEGHAPYDAAAENLIKIILPSLFKA